MKRRDLLRLGGASMLWMGLPHSLKSAPAHATGGSNPRLFFDADDISRIRANTRSSLLGPVYAEWAASPPEAIKARFDRLEETGDIIRDFRFAVSELTQNAMVQLLEPTKTRHDAIVEGIRRLLKIPRWDFLLDGSTPIGSQRASLATKNLLFVREIIWDDMDANLNKEMLDTIAEKGCLPCYRTVYGMENPDAVKGWRFDEAHAYYNDISMERWPMILGGNNLRSVPTGGLGIGALALLGHDERAELWLEAAIHSTRRVLTLFCDDGSYFEGISYMGYTMITSFSFMEVHQRIKGDIDWSKEADYDGMMNYILAMQAGLKEDGTPDVVNFGDARNSVAPCTTAWIGKETGNPLAQYATEHFTQPHSFLDFLWYDPKQPSASPPDSLKNYRSDLDWVVCRSGWEADDAVLAFRSGGPANHEHADRNSFIYKIHGERLLNDHFGAPYDWRKTGWPMRLSRGHNTVLVDGKGHHYHDGSEGTNASLSYANIRQYEDRGETVWWTSDATAAYRVENHQMFIALRTVLFAKPDIIVVLDQVRLRYRPQRVDLRFFPDNRDEAAAITAGRNSFLIERPRARLRGHVASRNTLTISETKLDVPPEDGIYPCVEIGSAPALSHEIITVLAAEPAAQRKSAALSVETIKEGWRVNAGHLQAFLFTDGHQPVIELS